jgi:hypothetical protein
MTKPTRPVPPKGKPEYDALDEALAESFPASDPVSQTVPTLPGRPDPPRGQSRGAPKRGGGKA